MFLSHNCLSSSLILHSNQLQHWTHAGAASWRSGINRVLVLQVQLVLPWWSWANNMVVAVLVTKDLALKLTIFTKALSLARQDVPGWSVCLHSHNETWWISLLRRGGDYHCWGGVRTVRASWGISLQGRGGDYHYWGWTRAFVAGTGRGLALLRWGWDFHCLEEQCAV